MKKLGFTFLLVFGGCFEMHAGQVHIGYIQLSGGVPSAGLQQLQLFNMTGSVNCDALSYTVCSDVSFSNWTLTVNYSQLGVDQTPAVFNWVSGTDNIGPFVAADGPYTGRPSEQWTFDQSCSSGFGCPPDAFDTVITAVTFTATVSSQSLTLFDSSFFQAQPTFTLSNWVPGNPFSDSIDLLLDDQPAPTGGGGGGVPEPSSLSLVAISAAAACISRVAARMPRGI